MMKNIKQFAGILVVLFSVVALGILVLAIWDVLDAATAKDALIKLAYTFVATMLVSLGVMALMQPKG